MPLVAHVGGSSQRDPLSAGREAASLARAGLGGAAPDVALVFATIGYDQTALLAAVGEALGGCALAGCTGEGVIGTAGSAEVSHAVEVVALSLGPGTRAQSQLIEGYADDPKAAAAALVDRLGDCRDLTSLMVFPDGLVGDCSTFIEEVRRRLPTVVVAGGTSGDAMTFERTYQFGGGRVGSGAVGVMALFGQARMKVQVSHGCVPIGPPQTITAIDGVWLRGIDGRPAWEVFKEYLDGDPQDLNADGIVHLCIGTAADPALPFGADNLIIRTPLALDARTGALMFPGGGLALGQQLRMTRRDPDCIRTTATRCAQSLVAGESGPPALVLQFDCAGRGKVMFGSAANEHIFTPLRSTIGPEVPWVGFHTYGEIAETKQGLRYHNYSVALCGLYEH